MAVGTKSETVVQTRGLRKVFRDFWRRPKVVALEGLNLKLEPGDVFGLLGPNGSGKSTAIKVLLGLLHPSAGSALLFGESPRSMAVRRRVGYLPELTWLHPFLSPLETLDYYGGLSGLPRRQRRQRARELIDMLDLGDAAHRPVGEFSKGMSRRVGLAQALIHDPDLIILDEPTSGLDPLGSRQVKDWIRMLAAQGRTVLMTSHLLADVADSCDRIAILHQGRCLAEGAVGSLLQAKDQVHFRVESIDRDQVESLRRDLAQRAGRTVTAERPAVSLEAFFLKVLAEHGAYPATGGRPQTGLAPFLQQPESAAAHRTRQ